MSGGRRQGLRIASAIAAAVIALLLKNVWNPAASRVEPPPVAAPGSPTVPASVSTSVARPEIGFRSREQLDSHFEKHGREFGGITRGEYLRRAQALRDAAVGGPIVEIRRPDGVISRFDRQSGGFVAFNRDHTLRTFFRPSDGEAYFRRQVEREH